MLDSKVLHFFFPEFFPVWDTAWIKKTIRGLERRRKIAQHGNWNFKGSHAGAAVAYAQYLELMFKDVGSSKRNIEKLTRTIVSSSARRNDHRALKTIVADNIGDLTPILFELCLLGQGRAAGVLR